VFTEETIFNYFFGFTERFYVFVRFYVEQKLIPNARQEPSLFRCTHHKDERRVEVLDGIC